MLEPAQRSAAELDVDEHQHKEPAPDERQPGADPARGLSEAEVEARRARGLGNDVALPTSRSYAQILRENVFTFVNNVLFGLGIALVLLSRVGDALVSVGVVSFNLLVGIVQEVRAKRTLDRIALLTRPKATVIRDGVERTVDPSEIVVGDMLVVRPGDQLVVDGQVVGDGRMEVDESLLTGESDLVLKTAGAPVYSGSFCVTGAAAYEAQQVGASSVASQLAAGARAFRRVLTPLQREINLVIRVILLVAVLLEILLALSTIIEGIPLVESVQMSVVIAGLIPNGLFLAIAVSYAMGAVRIARKGALVQQANAVESLSNVNVLCLDKTGTLTANRIRLEAVRPLRIGAAELRQILGDYAASASVGNKTSEAIGTACPGERRAVHAEVPFSSARKWSALALADEDVQGVYVLGAPEVLEPRLRPGPDLAALTGDWTDRGLRVVLFAYHPDAGALDHAEGEPRLPNDLTPLGLLSFSDELRPEARETLEGFSQAGVRLKIISGDNPQTVAALARQAGLDSEVKAVSGLDLDQVDEAQLAQTAEEATIFGRITPQQKERLVRALRRNGNYVAMVGDGVNDVLSLKQADLGIAMQSGSQATRAVADLVLLDDSFAVLPHAFREGQRILNGMQDILKLFLVRVLYVALLILSISVVGVGFPLGPKQSSLLALLTVGIPTVALAAWAQPGVRPRNGLVHTLLHFVLPAAITLAMVALGVYVAYFVLSLNAPLSATTHDERLAAQAVAQSALTTVTVLCGLLLILFAKPPTEVFTGGDVLSGDWRPTLLAVALLAAYVAILAVPTLGEFFELAPLRPADYLLLVGLAGAWGVFLRWTWRARLVDRFLGIEVGNRQ